MNLSESYARALFEVIEKDPKEAKKYINNLAESLKTRGHMKLLPQILSSFENLELKKERSASQKKVTPTQEQTRVLLELYRKLISVA